MFLLKLNMKNVDATTLYINPAHIVAIYTVDGTTRIVTSATNGNGSALNYAVTQAVGDVISRMETSMHAARTQDLRVRSDAELE